VDGRSLRVSEAYRLLAPHAAWIRERLEAGWHAGTVFEELPEELKEVSRSSFYRYLERHELNRLGERDRVVPEIRHAPGEALILDWGKLRDVIDPVTGRKAPLWMFIGVLGFSRFMVVRLVWTMDTPATLQAIEGMLRPLGGVPCKVTIDNPKCSALEASKYELLLNPAVERFASPYGVLFECLPPADPQQKGKVERQVPYGRRLSEAQGDTWLGLEESQRYLDRKVAMANERRHGTPLRRPKALVLEEAKALKPLPALAYAVEQFHEGPVRQDGHVRFANKDSSVDATYKGKSGVVLGTREPVSIYHHGKLLEVQVRIPDPHQATATKPQHLKPWERAMRDESFYRTRAQALGPQGDEMILKLLARGQGFIATRKIWGILSLDKRSPAGQIDAACRRALELDQLSFRVVKRSVELADRAALAPGAGQDDARRPAAPASRPAPKHVRPLSVYREQLNLFTEEGATGSPRVGHA
jgi:transposase